MGIFTGPYLSILLTGRRVEDPFVKQDGQSLVSFVPLYGFSGTTRFLQAEQILSSDLFMVS